MENKHNKRPNDSERGVPWISFCIATYRRPEILKKTLEQIKNQSFHDFEVIVSDNDPGQSSGAVVKEINDKRFHYFSNSENVGMVKNFNISLMKARGDFIVMIADDDPPRIDFLQTMRDLWQDNPNYGAYFGACEVVIACEDAAAAYQVNMGSIKFLADAPENAIRCYSREQYPKAFFEGKVFPYTLWSTGIVRRDIAVSVGGMPDFGSPLLTDLSYISVVGSFAGCATINKVVGGQVIHGGNSGMVDPHNVEIALAGSHEYIEKTLSSRPDWVNLKGSVEKFLARYIANHCVAMRVYLKNKGCKEEIEELKSSLVRMSAFPGMQKIRIYYFRSIILSNIKKILWFLIPTYKWARGLLYRSGLLT